MPPIDQRHSEKRSALRAVGMVVLITGLILTAVGLISFFSAFGSFEPPRYFWCAVIGLPLTGLGGMLLKFGYLGAMSRYAAGEMAPVAKDTFNDVAEGTQDGIRTVASAFGQGLSEGLAGDPALRTGEGTAASVSVRCSKCNTLNAEHAKFCSECGAALLKTRPCPGCGELNDPDARFCDNCGTTF